VPRGGIHDAGDKGSGVVGAVAELVLVQALLDERGAGDVAYRPVLAARFALRPARSDMARRWPRGTSASRGGEAKDIYKQQAFG
jgi:hypothetical protein